ncbi:hypothetical protein Q1695_009900 [Nippostrongylus brasiliensis]|nr:hypothetical protein Q1695_009900 [Nippostrongylus brasiliensis]
MRASPPQIGPEIQVNSNANVIMLISGSDRRIEVLENGRDEQQKLYGRRHTDIPRRARGHLGQSEEIRIQAIIGLSSVDEGTLGTRSMSLAVNIKSEQPRCREATGRGAQEGHDGPPYTAKTLLHPEKTFNCDRFGTLLKGRNAPSEAVNPSEASIEKNTPSNEF